MSTSELPRNSRAKKYVCPLLKPPIVVSVTEALCIMDGRLQLQHSPTVQCPCHPPAQSIVSIPNIWQKCLCLTCTSDFVSRSAAMLLVPMSLRSMDPSLMHSQMK